MKIEIIDALTGKRKKIDLNELVSSEKKSVEYILTIPHGGTFIPVKFEHKLNIGKGLLVGSDLFTEQLYNTNKGIAIVSRLNRYLVNMARFREGSKDKSLPKHLQRDPLHGVSPFGGEILKEEHSSEEKEIILSFYDRYHSFIERAIQKMRQKYGFALIFDCHSLNSIGLEDTPDKGEKRPDFIIGTLDDTSAHPRIISTFHETLKSEAEKFGLTVKKNHPYKGGFIAMKYGNPSENVHVIQVETKKSNYMDEGLEDSPNSFKLNSQGLATINSIISNAIKTTSEELKKK